MNEHAAPDASSTHAHQYDATALPLGMRVLAGGINTYLRAIALSSRHVVENVAPVQELQLDGKPVIILLWHERTFQVPSITSFCPRPLYALTSRSRDGAIIGNVMRKFGMRNIQGSGTGAAANKGTNPRKRGAQAYRAMLQVLRRGETVIATADVPPGPARAAGPGMIHLAARSGAPIVPLGISRAHQYRMRNSWDQLRVPLPFGRLAMVFADPIEIERDVSEARLAEIQTEISDRITGAQMQAESLTGETSD
ncbi:MAG: lysophospholipid acyltransferase family protein [Parvibaculales bacterium]